MSYTCSKHIEIMEIDDEWIVMNTEKFTVTKLNDLGAVILSDLKKGKAVEEMIKDIAIDHDADINIVESDVLSFLEDLKGIGLITNEKQTL